MKKIVLAALSGFLLLGCTRQKEEQAEGRIPVVYTVNYPLAYMAKRIGGDGVDVVFPDMVGDPAFWEPTAEQVAGFQQADLILLNGASYAKWISTASLPPSRMLDTSEGFRDRYIAMEGAVTHAHGPGGEHAHGGIAFTIWLDPQLAALQAAAIYETMSRKWAVDKTGLEALLTELQQLHAEWSAAFLPSVGKPLIGSHPVYQYLIRAYDLDMRSVHWEPDQYPDETMWRELEEVLETHPAKVMFWEDEPLAETKARLAEMGVVCIVFNPCGNRPEHGDFMDVMRRNVEGLRAPGH